ncbi:MAG: hypothetical protein DRP79_07515 [Planctomycetota bacterium]|nr:MAG: hypothetical protein DRP79_07515 [Planctomycetota bacterium]
MLKILKTIAVLLPVVVLVVIGAGALWAGHFAAGYNATYPNVMLGNRQEMVNQLKANGETIPFSFAVVGDTRCSETGERLLDDAAGEKDVRFVVHLGDFVRNPDIWEHRFFQVEMHEEISEPLPMFLVAGNHDLCFEAAHRSVPTDRLVGPKEFDELYGARKLHFTYADTLFILSDIDPSGDEYIAYIERALREKRSACRYVFVFLHIPPRSLSTEIDSRKLPQQHKLLALLKQYKVDRAFFGDFHGYWRGQVEGVNVLVTGGGGAHLAGDKTYGFHHLLVITVNDGMITERIITGQAETGWEDRIECFCFVQVFPRLGGSAWVYYALGGVMILAGICVSIAPLWKKLRGRKQKAASDRVAAQPSSFAQDA